MFELVRFVLLDFLDFLRFIPYELSPILSICLMSIPVAAMLVPAIIVAPTTPIIPCAAEFIGSTGSAIQDVDDNKI